MANVYVYLDETGVPSWEPTPESPFFGIGSALFRDDHHEQLAKLTDLRVDLSKTSVPLPKGFHAKDDTWATRKQVFSTLGDMNVEVRGTFFLKANAFERLKEREPFWLYKYAIYRHVLDVIRMHTGPGDDVHIVAATINLKSKHEACRDAFDDIAQQMPKDRKVQISIWTSESSPGLQVADYGLWARQRVLMKRDLSEDIRLPMRKIYRYWKPRGKEFPWGFEDR